MDNSIEQLNELKEMKDCVEKYCQLQEQIQKSDRDGMIKALSEASLIAHEEIVFIEHKQGDVIPMLWSDFSDADLYRKLKQYQRGILNHCIRKYGEERFNQFLKSLR